jgi:hypothetical protein
MCECFQGQEIDWENLRTPEQQTIMAHLASPIMAGLQMGATQFPGQLSAPKTRGQEAAERTMMDIGGWGYKPQRAQSQPVPGVNVPLFNFTNPGGQAGTGGGVPVPPGKDPKVIINPKQKGGGDLPLPPDGPKPYIKPEEEMMMQILQSVFNFDPRNIQG